MRLPRWRYPLDEDGQEDDCAYRFCWALVVVSLHLCTVSLCLMASGWGAMVLVDRDEEE